MSRNDSGLLQQHTAPSDDIGRLTTWWKWAVVLVATVAVVTRVWKLQEWSLWEDEEATIYYALNPHKAFPSYFPVFFVALRTLFHFFGLSIVSARLFSAMVGLASLWLAYWWLRRWLARETVLLGVLFMAVSLGHVFWSQSVRYYTAALAFQLLTVHWFFRGFEQRRQSDLFRSHAAFVLGLLTHFSAILLLPALIAYLFLVEWRRNGGGGYALKSYAAFVLPMAAVVALFGAQMRHLQGLMAPWVVGSARDPLHVLVTMVWYFGVPIVAIGSIAALRSWRGPSRIRLLLVVLTVVPVAELAVIAVLNVVNVTWYYGMIALAGFAFLSADFIAELFHRRQRGWSIGLAAGTMVYSAACLVMYFTVSAGDRPRWKEAGEYLSRTARVRPQARDNPAIFGTAPDVVAFYLGVAADSTQGQRLVQMPPRKPLTRCAGEEWYLFPAFEVTDQYREWLTRRCTLDANFPARTGLRDRSLGVYYCPCNDGS